MGNRGGGQLPCSQDEHEEVDDGGDMEAPLPADRSGKDTSKNHTDTKAEWLSSAHHGESDISLLAGREHLVDETDS